MARVPHAPLIVAPSPVERETVRKVLADHVEATWRIGDDVYIATWLRGEEPAEGRARLMKLEGAAFVDVADDFPASTVGHLMGPEPMRSGFPSALLQNPNRSLLMAFPRVRISWSKDPPEIYETAAGRWHRRPPPAIVHNQEIYAEHSRGHLFACRHRLGDPSKSAWYEVPSKPLTYAEPWELADHSIIDVREPLMSIVRVDGRSSDVYWVLGDDAVDAHRSLLRVRGSYHEEVALPEAARDLFVGEAGDLWIITDERVFRRTEQSWEPIGLGGVAPREILATHDNVVVVRDSDSSVWEIDL